MSVDFTEDFKEKYDIKDVKKAMQKLKDRIVMFESAYKIFESHYDKTNFEFTKQDFEFFHLNFSVQFNELVNDVQILDRKINKLALK